MNFKLLNPRIFLFFLILIFNGYILLNGYNVLDCQSYQPWPIDHTNNFNMTLTFQRWIYAWMNDCKSTKLINSKAILHNSGGLGHSIAQVAQNMVKLIELNQIFRPSEHWLWAEENAGECTGNLSSIDCYFFPISTCFPYVNDKYAVEQLHNPLPRFENKNRTHDYNISKDLEFSKDPIDICKMGLLAKKSLQWVCGQFLLYILRYREDFYNSIDEIVKPIKDVLKDQTYISVHVRFGGHKLDGGRRETNFGYYISLIDQIALELKAKNKIVKFVYIACYLDDFLGNSTTLSLKYPRPWNYLTIPHTPINQDYEEYLKNKTIRKENKTKKLYAVEFFADLEMLMNADAFIGSSSNIYFLVSNLRAALAVGQRNHTCLIHTITNKPNEVMCETSEAMKDLWMAVSGGGFKGGSPFQT